MRGRANIELVPSKRAPDSIISELAECPEMTAKTAGKKKARLVEREIVVDSIMRRWRGRLIFLRMQKGRDDHAGQGQREIIARTQRITAELERAAEGSELRAEATHVACAAALSSLHCEAGNGVRLGDE